MLEIFGGIAVITAMILLSGLKVVKEHDRLVVYRLGRVVGSRGPGLQMILPLVDKTQVVDTRIMSSAVPMLEDVTQDEHHVKASALCIFQIVDAEKAVTKIVDPVKGTSESAQAVLRASIGSYKLHQLVSHRRHVNAHLKSELEKRTKLWGVKIKSFEIKHLRIPKEMRKTWARAHRDLHPAANNGNQEDHAAKVVAPLAEHLTTDPRWYRRN